LIILCFYILGSTADGYLSPALETIAVKLGISESLAGVTFLAFGNGAPDVLSALSASGSDEDGIYLAISALLGAGLFVSSVVAAVVMMSAPEPIQVVPKVFVRDVGFYMLGPVIVTIAAATGELSVPFAVAFLVLYIIFVIVVVISDKMDSRKKKREMLITMQNIDSPVIQLSKREEEERLLEDEASPRGSSAVKINKSISNDASVQLSYESSQIFDGSSLHSDSIKDTHFDEKSEEQDYEANPALVIQKSIISRSLERTKHRVLWSLVKMNRFAKKSIAAENPWNQMNIIQKILYIIIDIPFDFFRRLTIPPGNDEQWDRRFAVAFPFCSLTFFFLAAGLIDFSGLPPFYYWILLAIAF
jgi:Ca2+/Na+ antiporter